MISNDLNLNQLRFFEVVYRTRSMTEASKILHLTQSGISQHIKKLEESLGFILFDRVKLRLVPTNEGRILYEKISRMMGDLEHCLSDIQTSMGKISGKIRIGMPIEFGNNFIMNHISELSHKHPDLQFQFYYGFVTEMNGRLLAGEIDFAFIDSFNVDRRVKSTKVYDELLHLCCTKKYLKDKKLKNMKPQELMKLDYIDYQEEGPLAQLWFKHHYDLPHLALTIKAAVMDVQGVARMIQGGMGAGILPGHLTEQIEKSGVDLHRFQGSGKALINSIELAQLKDHTLSPAAEYVLQFLQSRF